MAGGTAMHAPAWRETMRTGAQRGGTALGGVALVAAAAIVAAALASYHVTDPALNTAAAGPPANWLGPIGAWSADLLLSLLGPCAALLVPFALVRGLRWTRGAPAGEWMRGLLFVALASLLIGTALELWLGRTAGPALPAGWGGVLGLAGDGLAERGLALLPATPYATAIRLGLRSAARARRGRRGGLWHRPEHRRTALADGATWRQGGDGSPAPPRRDPRGTARESERSRDA